MVLIVKNLITPFPCPILCLFSDPFYSHPLLTNVAFVSCHRLARLHFLGNQVVFCRHVLDFKSCRVLRFRGVRRRQDKGKWKTRK